MSDDENYKPLDVVPESAVGAYGKPNTVLKAGCDYVDGTSPGMVKDYSKPVQSDLFTDSIIKHPESRSV